MHILSFKQGYTENLKSLGTTGNIVCDFDSVLLRFISIFQVHFGSVQPWCSQQP